MNAIRKPPTTPEAQYLNPDDLPRAIETMMPKDEVYALAQTTGFHQRDRKLDPFAFVLILVTGFGIRLQRTLASLRRDYKDHTGDGFTDSAWHERFNPGTVRFLKACVVMVMQRMTGEINRTLSPKLAHFRDIVIQDSTIIRLCAQLIKKWPGTRGRKPVAGLKVSMLISAVANGPQKVTIHG